MDEYKLKLSDLNPLNGRESYEKRNVQARNLREINSATSAYPKFKSNNDETRIRYNTIRIYHDVAIPILVLGSLAGAVGLVKKLIE